MREWLVASGVVEGRAWEACPPWVREPLAAWLHERWGDRRSWRYRIDGETRAEMQVRQL